MTDEKKLELLAEILDCDVEELSPEMELSSFEWDSVAVLSFIAMMDEEFGKAVKGAEIKKLVTIQDALDIMES
jgi:acyl carrier protein